MLVVVPATKKGIHNNFQKFSFPAFSFLTLYRNIIIQMIELLVDDKKIGTLTPWL